MRVLLIVDCYLPSTKSVAQLTHDLARELSAQSHEVTILAPACEDSRPGTVSENGVTVIRYRIGRTKGVNLVVRAFNEMSISFVALWRARGSLAGRRFDYIVFYSPSIFLGPLVHRLKRRWGARAYLILRDIFPDWAVDAGVMKRGVAYRAFKVFERIQYSAADVIGVETSRSFEYFHGTPFESRTELLRNWTTTTKPPRCPRTVRKELGLEGKVVFFYGGNLGVAQDMDNLLRLARRFSDRSDVHFLVVGDGSERRRLTDTVERDRMSNVTILGPVDQSSYMSMLSEFDVGVITLDRRLKTFSNTGKLLGYLRCGLPILASYNPGNDLEDLLRESGAGFGSVNGDDDVFYEHALRLCDARTRREMGANATRLLESFAVEKVATQILEAAIAPSRPA